MPQRSGAGLRNQRARRAVKDLNVKTRAAGYCVAPWERSSSLTLF